MVMGHFGPQSLRVGKKLGPDRVKMHLLQDLLVSNHRIM